METRILPPTDSSLLEATQILSRGGLVAIPTETVYGLAANALNASAVARVFEVKDRPSFDPLIVHLGPGLLGKDWDKAPSHSLEQAGLIDLRTWSAKQKQCADLLMNSFWPGPLTLLFPKSDRIPDLVTAGLKEAGIRVPAHPVALGLLNLLDFPLAAPSANRFGRISPTRAEDVSRELGGRIDLILDGGATLVGVESTVLRVTPEAEIQVLRPGGLSVEELREKSKRVSLSEERTTLASASPGMLGSHYAPRKELHLVPCAWGKASSENLKQWLSAVSPQGKKIGFLLCSEEAKPLEKRIQALFPGLSARFLTLTPRSDAKEAAYRLFSSLRELDSSDVDLIFCDSCPSQDGLWLAIADRISRAAAIKFQA